MLILGRPPGAEAQTTVTGYAYVAGYNTVAVISGTQIITTLATTSSGTAIGVNPTTGHVYLADYYNDNVTVLSGTEVVGTLAVGASPISVGVNPISGLIYVANHLGQSISIIGDMLPVRVFLPLVLKND